jgi:hypothetical protein
MAARVVGSGQSSRGKATPRRGRGGGNISGGRGMNVVPQVVDNGGSEGKTIPVEVTCAIPIGELDTSYLVHHRGNPKKRPPTKYDNSFTFEHRNYEGLATQVKIAREENPYVSPKLTAIDYRFWSVFHFQFYSSVLSGKNNIIAMKWIDWDHFERHGAGRPEAEEVLELVEKWQIKDLMSFKHDWNTEVIAQFHATFFYDVEEDAIHWMTEKVHYKVNFTTFGRLLSFGDKDRRADIIHNEEHKKAVTP